MDLGTTTSGTAVIDDKMRVMELEIRPTTVDCEEAVAAALADVDAASIRHLALAREMSQ